MSIAAADARNSRRFQQPNSPFRITRRCLGDSVAGPPLSDISANWKFATQLLTRSPGSYAEFKQQCVSFRLFAFAGVCGGCVLSLMMDPPKSSYWVRYGPSGYFHSIAGAFGGSSPPVFLTSKAEHQADAPAIVKELITTRRLASAGSDSEE